MNDDLNSIKIYFSGFFLGSEITPLLGAGLALIAAAAFAYYFLDSKILALILFIAGILTLAFAAFKVFY